MLQGSGAMPTLVVEEGPSDYSSDQTDPEESPNLAPTTLPRSRSVHTSKPNTKLKKTIRGIVASVTSHTPLQKTSGSKYEAIQS